MEVELAEQAVVLSGLEPTAAQQLHGEHCPEGPPRLRQGVADRAAQRPAGRHGGHEQVVAPVEDVPQDGHRPLEPLTGGGVHLAARAEDGRETGHVDARRTEPAELQAQALGLRLRRDALGGKERLRLLQGARERGAEVGNGPGQRTERGGHAGVIRHNDRTPRSAG